MISDYKAIIFDWDGTLVDTCGLVLDAHNHVRRYMGHDLWTMDDFLGQASKSAREYYPEVYGERADEAQKVLYEYVDENHLTYLKPMPDASTLLTFIQEAGTPMGVVSNKRHETLHIEVKETRWEPYFKTIIGAGKAEKDKPSSDPLLMGIAAIDNTFMPSDILYIGDTETDLLCAKNTGSPVVFVQSDKPRPDLVDKYQPEFVCNDLAGLILLLQGQAKANKAC